MRRLRPTQSELGQIDPAAFFEFQKGVKIFYEANSTTSCLVEMDEEPPHPLNVEATEIVLTAALLMKGKPIDEIHVMRKTVIDGSNTTGFQRTCVIALNGEVKIGEKTVPIQHTSLEEDAARKIGDEDDSTIRYRIDRLGIPLIEVATAPTITSPEEAQEVAFAIGRILRSTGKVMRGLGTIRQDLNVSISNGALIEIKGVQDLELISVVIKNEVQRQLNLLKISEELRKNGVKEGDLKEKFFDITNVFSQTRSNIIRKALEKNQKILALKLPKFGGFLKREVLPNLRLGSEMADRARFWGKVGGIFHTDELPSFGITIEEVELLKNAVKGKEEDVVVFIADKLENIREALKAVLERAREAINGVPEETRAAKPDGTTRYMRPRPGAARMYPETDISHTQIGEEYIKKISACLPELLEEKLERLIREYKLNHKLAKQTLNSGYGELFETIVKENIISPTTVAVFLTETLKSMKRDGIDVEKIPENLIREIFRSISLGEIAKEAVSDIAIWLSKHEDKSLKEAITNLGLSIISEEKLQKIINATIKTNRILIEERKRSAFGSIMGMVMTKVRGKANVELVSKLIKKRLDELVNVNKDHKH